MSTATPTNQTPAGQGARCTGRARALLRDSRGALLLETVIASMVFALVGVAVLAGLSTLYSSGAKTEVQSVAENLARNQMEFVFCERFQEAPVTFPPMVSNDRCEARDIPEGYEVVASAEPTEADDPEVQRVTVAVSYDSREILRLQTLRGRTDGLQLRYTDDSECPDSCRLHGTDVGANAPCECEEIYVFLDNPENEQIVSVEYWLDEALMAAEDLNPLQIGDLGYGSYTLKATVDLADGYTVNFTSKFKISN